MLDNKTLANKNYVNDRFKTYHNRDANQDELNQFTGKGLFDVDKAIGAGANTAKLPTAPKLPDTIDSGILSAGMKTGDISSQLPETTAGIIKETEVLNAQKFSEGAKGTLKIYEQQMKDAQANKKTAEDELKKIEADRDNQVTDRFEELSQPYRQKMEEAGNTEFELKEKYQKYSSLANSLTVYADQAYNDLQAEKNRPSLASVSQGRQAIIKDDYNSKIALTQTAMAALSGDIALGRTFIDRGIEAVTADRADELNFLNFVNDLFNEKSDDAKADLLTATTEEKNAIQNRITTIENEFTRIENEKSVVQEFLVGDNARIAVKAGVSLSDSLDEMVSKVAEYYKNNPEEFKKTAPELTLDQKLKLYEKGLNLDQSGNITETDDTAPATLSIGSGTITGLNGSDLWEWGLDFVLAEGKGAEVKTPFIGEVIFAGENGGFGNQVKVKTASGEEIWLSHLNDISVKVGDQVNEESIVGTQGNTGNVYSTTGGDGTHLDITIKKPDGSFYKANEVASLLGYQGQQSSESEFDKYSNEQIALAVLPTQLKNSEMELERALTGIRAGLKEGKTPYEIADTLMGYKVSNPDDFSDNMRKFISVGDFNNNQIAEMARLINAGNKVEAMSKAENNIMAEAKKIDPDGYIGEPTAKTAVEKSKNLAEKINALPEEENPIGNFSGTFEEWIGRFKSKEAQTIATDITDAIKEMRKRLLGSAVTPSEEEFLNPIIPKLSDTAENFMIKLEKLRTAPLLELNSVRSTFSLPVLNENALLDKYERVGLYDGGGMNNLDNAWQPEEQVDDLNNIWQ